jgi:hypothetical protein
MRETTGGTSITVVPGEADEATGPLRWRGEWRDTVNDYVENDLVIRGSNNFSSINWNAADGILGDGTLAGLFIAIRDVPVNTPPTEPYDPEATVYWETFARYATHIFALRTRGSLADNRIYLDATVNSAASAQASVSIRLQDCNGKDLSIREINVCVNGDPTYKMMVLGSAPYR